MPSAAPPGSPPPKPGSPPSEPPPPLSAAPPPASSGPDADPSTPDHNLLHRLADPAATFTLDELQAISLRLPDAPAPPELTLSLAERFIAIGEPLLAFQLLTPLQADLTASRQPGHPFLPLAARSTRLLALTLIEAGAPHAAAQLLRTLCEADCATPDTLALLGRACRRIAERAPSLESRHHWLEQSFASYFSAFNQAEARFIAHGDDVAAADACHSGIQAAILMVLRDQASEARSLAARVLQICLHRLHRIASQGASADFALLAARAQADLITGNLPEAQIACRTALASAPGSAPQLTTLRRHLRLMAPRLGIHPPSIHQLLPPPVIAAFIPPPFISPVQGAPGPSSADLDDWEQTFRQSLLQQLHQAGATLAFSSAISPADIIFIDAVLASHGIHLTVILPAHRSRSRLLLPAHGPWRDRFDSLIPRVHLILGEEASPDPPSQAQPDGQAHDGTGGDADDPLPPPACTRYQTLGAAILTAQHLEAALHLWATPGFPVPQNLPAAGPAPVLHPLTPAQYPFPIPAHESPSAAAAASGAGPAADSIAPVRPTLLLHITGADSLSDTGLLRLADQFLHRLAAVLDTEPARILTRRAAPSTLFLTLTDVDSAALIAVRLSDMVTSTSWPQFGLPASLGIRILLDAGPLATFHHPVTRTPDVSGAFPSRAAQLPLATPPGQVFATHTFAALHAASAPAPSTRLIHFRPAGHIPAPPPLDFIPVFSLSRS